MSNKLFIAVLCRGLDVPLPEDTWPRTHLPPRAQTLQGLIKLYADALNHVRPNALVEFQLSGDRFLGPGDDPDWGRGVRFDIPCAGSFVVYGLCNSTDADPYITVGVSRLFSDGPQEQLRVEASDPSHFRISQKDGGDAPSQELQKCLEEFTAQLKQVIDDACSAAAA
jgi:hypothetical protein